MRVFLNEDWIHYLWSRYEQEIEKEDLQDFIRQYKDTTITDFCFNVNGTVSTSMSTVLQTWIDKYLTREENGVAVDYTNTFARLAYDLFVNKGLDMYDVWIDECKKIGINPWLSFRMNDTHGSNEITELRKSTQVDKFASSLVSSHRKGLSGFFDYCYDYSKKKVRDLMYAYIKEQVERYDVYGIELDLHERVVVFLVERRAKGLILWLISCALFVCF